MSSREQYEASQVEVARLNENKVRLGVAYHNLDARCDRYRTALEQVVARGTFCEACPSVYRGHPASWCATCVARAALEAPDA